MLEVQETQNTPFAATIASTVKRTYCEIGLKNIDSSSIFNGNLVF